MTTKASPLISRRAQRWREIDDLYHRLLYWYYERGNRQKARPVARRLERRLTQTASGEKIILGEAAWSLVLECKGDLLGAIKHREKEIGLIKRLLQISAKSANGDSIFKHYDYADLSDRLDLLAILYHDAGNLDQALKVLRQSKVLCDKHGIRFDGQELWDDYLAERIESSHSPPRNSQKKAV
jgi:tetratricopeptide (TPR) repeat protein